MNIFIINTPYHLLISTALIREDDLIVIIDDFDYKESYFCQLIINKILSSNSLILVEGLRKQKHKTYNKLLKLKRSIKDAIGRNKEIKDVYCFNDSNPINQFIISRLPSYSKLFVVEEGIGLYRNIENRHLIIRKLLGRFIFGRGFQNIDRIGEYKNTTNIICNYPNLLNEIQKSKEIMLMNKFNFVDLFNSHFDKIGGEFKLINEETIDLFIGQPLVEDGVITEERYISALKNVFNKIIRDNVVFYIKPHPRENIEKYKYLQERFNVKIYLQKDLPVEIILAKMKQPRVYTAYSSAALNTAKHLGIQTFLLYKLFDYDPHIPNEMLDEKYINKISDYDEL